MKPAPTTVLYARILVGLNGLTWMGFGAVVLLGGHPAYAQSEDLRLSVAAAALMVGAVLWTLAVELGRPRPILYWATLGLLGAATIAAMFDTIGVADQAYAIVTGATLAVLLKDRAWHLQNAG
ncbi:MAG: hypothetical protein ABIQ99_00655 [Thermoflexales bacterium]